MRSLWGSPQGPPSLTATLPATQPPLEWAHKWGWPWPWSAWEPRQSSEGGHQGKAGRGRGNPQGQLSGYSVLTPSPGRRLAGVGGRGSGGRGGSGQGPTLGQMLRKPETQSLLETRRPGEGP